ncbi:MAG: nitroreductase [Ruminococcaceae bacterium]|nr:nitroreductase [Oscillospiraceae bacterium]
MEIFDIIKRRRTIRSFKQIPVEDEKLDMMIEAARLAPSGGNLQPIKYIVVNSKEYCDKLFPLTKWAGYTAPEGVPSKEDAPTAYIIILIDEDIRKDGNNDAAYAGENIVLTAEGMGIGSCIIGSVLRKEATELFEIPDNLKIHTVIALGYPNQKSFVFDTEEGIKYYLDEDGNFHVPKRKKEDVTKYF